MESNRILTWSQGVSHKVSVNYTENSNNFTAEKPGRRHLNKGTQTNLPGNGTPAYAVPPDMGHREGQSGASESGHPETADKCTRRVLLQDYRPVLAENHDVTRPKDEGPTPD